MHYLFLVFIVFSLILFGIYIARFGWERVVMILPALFPAYVIDLPYLVRFNFLELLLIELALCFVIDVIRNKDKIRAHIVHTLNSDYLFLVGLYVLAGLISLFSYSYGSGYWNWLEFQHGMLFPVLYFFLILMIRKDKFQTPLLFHSLLFSGIGMAVLAFTKEYIGRFDAQHRLIEYYDAITASFGLYIAPLVTFAIIGIEQCEEKKSLFQRMILFTKKLFHLSRSHASIYFYWLSFVLLAIVLYISHEYIFWIASFMGFIFYYVLKDRKVDLEKILAIFAGVVLISGLIGMQVLPGGSLYAPFSVQGYSWLSFFSTIWAKTGILGLIFFISWIVFSYVRLFKHKSHEVSMPLLLGLSLLTTFLFSIFWTPLFFKEDLALMFWMLMGVVWRE